MGMACLCMWRLMKRMFSTENTITVDAGAEVGWSDWLNDLRENAGFRSLPVVMHDAETFSFRSPSVRNSCRHRCLGRICDISRINNGVYLIVVVHAQHFVDPVHADIHTQTIEGFYGCRLNGNCISKVGQAGPCFRVTFRNSSSTDYVFFDVNTVTRRY